MLTPELLKKLDKTKMYSWDEVMEIAACISTQVMIEFMMDDKVRKDILYAIYNIPNNKIETKTNSRRRKKQSKST